MNIAADCASSQKCFASCKILIWQIVSFSLSGLLNQWNGALGWTTGMGTKYTAAVIPGHK